jgi:sterol desaturase/sphingolipid hydroxylase (fatty acid hydroxylase superfamily)
VPICGFLVSELFLYAAHRAEHGVCALWRMHVVHHSDIELDASTGFRHFPAEAALHVVIGTAIFVVLGVPAWVGVAYGMLSYVVGVTQHANVRVFAPHWDRALQWVLVTPDMHRVHHSICRADHDSNFGNILSIWDHLFGSYRAVSAAAHAAMEFGIAELRGEAEARPDRVFLQPFRPALGTRPP